MTPAGTKLFAKLPEMFILVEEEVSTWRLGPTEVHEVGGSKVFSFGPGDARAFDCLVKSGSIVAEKVDGKWVYAKVVAS